MHSLIKPETLKRILRHSKGTKPQKAGPGRIIKKDQGHQRPS
jgi:hypothetical protein